MLKNFRALASSVFLAASLLAPSAEAAVSPLGLTLFPPVQLPPTDFTIAGARVGLVGKHRNVYGFDVGVVNITETNFGGVQAAGLFNWNRGSTTAVGLQLAGFANVNVNKARIVGIQAAAGFNSNQAESSLVGLQIAVANVSPYMNIYGLQVGAYNRAKEVFGLQIGLVNVADDLHGIQIGLLNFNHKGLFAVAPILNVGF